MAGFGTMAFGTGPFGLGTPTTSTAPPDPSGAGSRYINPATRDYQQDSTTLQLAQMPGLRQRVLLAVMTLRTSSTALPTFGISIPRKVTPSFVAEVQASVRASLRQMTEVERVIRIDGITVEIGASGRQRVTISYTDTSAGVPDAVTF